MQAGTYAASVAKPDPTLVKLVFSLFSFSSSLLTLLSSPSFVPCFLCAAARFHCYLRAPVAVVPDLSTSAHRVHHLQSCCPLPRATHHSRDSPQGLDPFVRPPRSPKPALQTLPSHHQDVPPQSRIRHPCRDIHSRARPSLSRRPVDGARILRHRRLCLKPLFIFISSSLRLRLLSRIVVHRPTSPAELHWRSPAPARRAQTSKVRHGQNRQEPTGSALPASPSSIRQLFFFALCATYDSP